MSHCAHKRPTFDTYCDECVDNLRRRLDEERVLSKSWYERMVCFKGRYERQAARAGRFRAERDRARNMDHERPTIAQVLPLLRAYYAMPGNGVGGSLHLVLEDPNYEDHHVLACYETAMMHDDSAGALLALVLLAMSKTQRRKLGGMSHYPRASA